MAVGRMILKPCKIAIWSKMKMMGAYALNDVSYDPKLKLLKSLKFVCFSDFHSQNLSV
jgi:hypothetical protein